MARRMDLYSRVTVWARRLGPHYGWILLVALLLTGASALVTTRLRFNSDLADLLPTDHPDLKILRDVQAKYATDTGFMILLSQDLVFTADDAGVLRMHDGRSWIQTPTGRALHALWGLGPDRVLAAGDGGRIWRFDGRRWRSQPSGVSSPLRAIWGDRPDRIFAVGDGGAITRFDGARWIPQPSPTRRDLLAISGRGGEVIAVGRQGTILRLGTAGRWSAQPAAATEDLRGVWVEGPGRAAAVGARGAFLLLGPGGRTWRRVPSGTVETLRGVWGTRLANIQAAGDGGLVLRYDGARIRRQRSGTSRSLAAIHGVRHDEVWAVGDGCTVRRFDWRWRGGPVDVLQQRASSGSLLTRLIRRAPPPERSCAGRLTAVWRPRPDLGWARRLAPRLAAAAAKSPNVSRVDYKKPVQFFWDRALLFSSVEDLRRLRSEIEENLRRETARGSGLYVDLEEERGRSSRRELTRLYEKYERLAAGFGASEWYEHPDGASLGLVVYPTRGVSDFENLRRLRAELEQVVADVVGPELPGPLRRVDVSGDAVSKLLEYDATVNDVFGKIWIAVVGIILLMLIYFRRLVGLVFVALPLGMSISWTFAITTLFIGTLNAVTGFLFAVLFGLGIDYGLQLYARYREGRSAGLSPEDAMNHVVLDTGRATLTSALTTSAALLTLTVTDFKGFSEFGFIAGVGVLLALISFILVMPAMIFLAERVGLLRIPVTPPLSPERAVRARPGALPPAPGRAAPLPGRAGLRRLRHGPRALRV